VTVREDAPGDRRLVAYAALAPGTSLDLPALQEALRRTLPEPMLPGALVVLPELPRTASGKVDRAALPAPGLGRAAGAHVEPESPLERTIAAVMRDALRVERVGRDDSFFHLGGHSLLMIRAAGMLEQLLGRKVQVIELFRFPTVAALAAFLDEGDRGAPSGEEMARRGAERRQERGRRRDRREAAAGAGREAAAALVASASALAEPGREAGTLAASAGVGGEAAAIRVASAPAPAHPGREADLAAPVLIGRDAAALAEPAAAGREAALAAVAPGDGGGGVSRVPAGAQRNRDEP
jgi:acyl carrier protein